MQSTRVRRTVVRIGTFLAAAALLATGAPAVAGEAPGAVRAQAPRREPPRTHGGGGLLLLSFLVPLPLPMAVVAPPSTRPTARAPAPSHESGAHAARPQRGEAAKTARR